MNENEFKLIECALLELYCLGKLKEIVPCSDLDTINMLDCYGEKGLANLEWETSTFKLWHTTLKDRAEFKKSQKNRTWWRKWWGK